MNAQEIERTEFAEATTEQLQVRAALADDARRLLGYKRLAEKVAAGTLLGALKELDTHPFVESAVNSYKRSKERIGLWREQKIGICLLMGSVGTACLLAYSIHQTNVLPASFAPAFIFAIIGIVLSAVATVITQAAGWVGVTNNFSSDSRNRRVWETVSLDAYRGEVPEFVLRKAVAIKNKVPLAIFHVQHLVVKEEEVIRYDPDPFLIVGTRESRELYYIEVWDERDFEKTL